MSIPPRLALAIPVDGSEPAAASLALLGLLRQKGLKVQHFGSRARPYGSRAIAEVTGLPGRHLDTWLMPPQLCRCLFARGASGADLAVVEGTLRPIARRPDSYPYDRPGDLAPLANLLGLPLVAVVSCRNQEDFHLPHLPPGATGVLLDGLERPEDFDAISRLVQHSAHRPVVGAVEALPAVRKALRETPVNVPHPPELIEQLAASLRKFIRLDALLALAETGPLDTDDPDSPCRSCGGFRVAYALDEAFGAYFPDTLETLATIGAEMLEFSPLRSEALPPHVDLVMIGCGFPDRFADRLTQNVSLMCDLKRHVTAGHRLYAEGGGMAYLGRSLDLGDRTIAGAGVLPFDARLRTKPGCLTPVSRTLDRASWLGAPDTPVRGYRSGRWSIVPAFDQKIDCPRKCGTLTRQQDIYFRQNAVGSLIHLHLAALPQFVRAFATTSHLKPITPRMT